MRSTAWMVVFLLLAGCGEKSTAGQDSASGPPAVIVDTALVESLKVERSITAIGNLEAPERVQVTSEIKGKIVAIHFEEGAVVPFENGKPRLLFSLDSEALDNAVLEARERVKQAHLMVKSANLQEKTARLRIEAAGLSVQNKHEQVGKLELELVQRKTDFQRKQTMLEGNATTKSAYDNTKLALDQTIVALRQAKVMLRRGQVALHQTKTDAQQAVVGQSRADVGVTQAQIALEQAIVQQNKAKVHAPPFSGVAGERQVSVGAFVKDGDPLVEILQVNPIEVVFSVPERYRSDLRLGLTASIVTQATGKRTFQGQVTYIAPDSQPTTRTIRLKAKLANSDGTLKPGLFARVHLSLGEAWNSLVVPEQAIVPRGGRFYVYVSEGHVARKRAVTLGQRLPGKVVVSTGLQASERIIVSGLQRVSDGFPVQERKE